MYTFSELIFVLCWSWKKFPENDITVLTSQLNIIMVIHLSLQLGHDRQWKK